MEKAKAETATTTAAMVEEEEITDTTEETVKAKGGISLPFQIS